MHVVEPSFKNRPHIYIRVAHSSVFSVIFASFSVSFFMKFGGHFVNLAGKNGTKNAVKNDEKWLL